MNEPRQGKPRQPAVVTRQQIIDVASALFYTQGIRAVGMDAIVRALGMGTMTLYRQFPTKDDLVVAYIQAQSQRWWGLLKAAQAAARPDPPSQLFAVFEQLDRDIAAPGFRGCPFLNTITEFPDPAHPAHVAALQHKAAIRTYLRDLAVMAEVADSDALADTLIVLMDGAYETAMAFGPDGPAQQTRRVVQCLIAQ